jgi:hypothetical protein
MDELDQDAQASAERKNMLKDSIQRFLDQLRGINPTF